MDFKLPRKFRFDPKLRFDNERDEQMYNVIRAKALRDGCLRRKDFLRLAKWKSRRLMGHAVKNTADEIAEITRVSLAASTERCRITSLLGLAGVSWPMASVVLHICHREPYPILDVRALGALGCREKPLYSFAFWVEYVRASRKLAKALNTDMRTFDHNLFEWSRETGVMAR
jgi:hypothetical protein